MKKIFISFINIIFFLPPSIWPSMPGKDKLNERFTATLVILLALCGEGRKFSIGVNRANEILRIVRQNL